MTSTLSVPIEIPARVHAIVGGGYWAEVPSLPGCVAQAETLEALRENIRAAIADWMAESAVKTHGEASRLAAMQGADTPPAIAAFLFGDSRLLSLQRCGDRYSR